MKLTLRAGAQLIILAMLTLSAQAEGVRLKAGEIFTFTFGTLEPFALPPNPDRPSDQISLDLHFGFVNPLEIFEWTGPGPFPGDGVSAGERLSVLCFENADSSFPFYTFPLDGSILSVTPGSSFGHGLAQKHWADREGKVSLQMIEGTAEINAARIWVTADGLTHTSTLVIPEPSLAKLTSLGVLIFAGMSWRKII